MIHDDNDDDDDGCDDEWFDFFHSFKATNCDYYFNHVFRPVRMRLDLNTNMELVGLREPYKANYKVTKNPGKTQHRQTSLKFDRTAVAFKLPFLSNFSA